MEGHNILEQVNLRYISLTPFIYFILFYDIIFIFIF